MIDIYLCVLFFFQVCLFGYVFGFCGFACGAKHSSYLKICRPGGASVLAPCRVDVFFEHVLQIWTDQSASDRDRASVTFLIKLVLHADTEISTRGGP